jgi:hypothetical protein
MKTVDDLKHVQLLIVFKHKHPDPAGRNSPHQDVCWMSDIWHFRTSEPDSGTPLVEKCVLHCRKKFFKFMSLSTDVDLLVMWFTEILKDPSIESN